MSEHLAFHQFLGDRAAIDRDERAVAARTQLMDRLGAKLLAGAALAGDEHGRAACGGVFDHVVDAAHRHRGADQPAESAGLDDVARRGERFEPPPFERVADRDQQPVGREGLDDKVIGAFAHRLDRNLDRAVGGDDDHRAGQVACANRPQDFDPVRVRQLEVEQHDIGDRLAQRLVRARSGSGIDQLDIELGQELVVKMQDRRRVFDQQKARFGGHASSLSTFPS